MGSWRQPLSAWRWDGQVLETRAAVRDEWVAMAALALALALALVVVVAALVVVVVAAAVAVVVAVPMVASMVCGGGCGVAERDDEGHAGDVIASVQTLPAIPRPTLTQHPSAAPQLTPNL